jgi:hypothetical protein
MKIFVCNKLYDFFTIYSKEIMYICNNSNFTTDQFKQANYLITCLSDELNYPIYGNMDYANSKNKIKDINMFIKKFVNLNNSQKIIVFYHTPKVFIDNTINVCYSIPDDDNKNIVICPPAIKQYKFNKNINKKYLISFKGNVNASKERNDVFNIFSKYSNDKNIFIERNNNNYDYDELMNNSLFSLIIQGDLPWSYRFTESINAGSIPIIIKPQNQNILAFHELIDYSKFSIIIDQNNIHDLMTNILPNLLLESINNMLTNLEIVNNKYFISRKNQMEGLFEILEKKCI